MSTYRKIHGRSIQAVTTDPTETVSEGQVWYNTTSDTFKTTLVSEAWSSGASMTDARADLAGAGTQTAGLAMAGIDRPSTPKNVSEEYNGSGWASGGNTPGAKSQCAGAGSQTAAIVFGGASSSNTTFEYDGSSFSAGGTMNTGRSLLAGFGTATAGVGAGGYTPGPTNQNAVEEYNGSAWTAGNTLTTARRSISGTGPTESTGMVFGGNTGSVTGATEEYDGTNWTTGGSLNTAREGMGGSGSSTLGLAFSGYTTTNVTNSEEYNGTSWSEGPDVATARRFLAGSVGGTAPAALAFGGFASNDTGSTEEFNKSANVITAAAWASASNFPGPASSVRGFGAVHSASVAIGGETGPGPTVSSCYSYDGSSWTSVPAIPNTARNVFAYGTQTAGLYSGGNTSPGQTPISNASAEWDGSGWTGGPTVPTSRGFGASSGVQTSALSTAGDQGGSPFAATAVDSYNGSTWTSETAYPGGAYGMTGCGRSETTAFVFGGEAPYPGSNANVATYNGSAWTTTATPVNTLLPANTQQASSYGEQDNCIAFGGTSSQSATAGWDGTAWSTRPSMGTGRSAGGTGISTDALAFCGSPVPNGGNKTEEFIGETSALNVKTLTQS